MTIADPPTSYLKLQPFTNTSFDKELYRVGEFCVLFPHDCRSGKMCQTASWQKTPLPATHDEQEAHFLISELLYLIA